MVRRIRLILPQMMTMVLVMVMVMIPVFRLID